MKVDLHNKLAVVTGAARGIGLATAEALAANGAQVIIADIDEEAALLAAKSIPSALALRMDVADAGEVENGFKWIDENVGHTSILINNAGVNTFKHRITIDQFPIEEWDRIMDVDLRGVFLASRAACSRMTSNGGGRIVNVASVLGLVPARLQSAFIAAKAGVINLTRAMAIEMAQSNILVNCIAPGSTLSDGTKKLYNDETELARDRTQRLLSHIPLGRIGRAEEMAHAVLFLVAPESSYITGQTLVVDGGWSAGGYFRDF